MDKLFSETILIVMSKQHDTVLGAGQESFDNIESVSW